MVSSSRSLPPGTLQPPGWPHLAPDELDRGRLRPPGSGGGGLEVAHQLPDHRPYLSREPCRRDCRHVRNLALDESAEEGLACGAPNGILRGNGVPKAEDDIVHPVGGPRSRPHGLAASSPENPQLEARLTRQKRLRPKAGNRVVGEKPRVKDVCLPARWAGEKRVDHRGFAAEGPEYGHVVSAR